MTKDEYVLLYEKYMAGLCTFQEEQIIKNYQDELDLSDAPWDAEKMGDMDSTREFIYDRLQKSIRKQNRPIPLYSIIRWSAAAIVLFALSFIIYQRLFTVKHQNSEQIAQHQRYKEDILPGGNKAILTLANGSKIILDNAQNGVLATQGNTNVKKTGSGTLVYNMASANVNVPSTSINTISTPRGGQYQIILPDGSKVWLNAASSLKFPTAFTGSVRNVELVGEAYFEVAKNKEMPFKVKVNNMEVQVLGTHFNIMAYQDEANIKTTLLEGSVRIKNGSSTAMLMPGQQAVLNRTANSLKVNQANTDEAVAWKQGLFVFNDEDIQAVMRKVSRWYDVDVTYEGNMAGKDFTGTVSKFKNASEVLKMLELTGIVHFDVKGRKITVMP